ncbi:MAG TPA: FAD binding domain-containing protein [Anaerolineaceae bacterium]|nr:FAD binding domain-containing protein [Anaerolineaceae bacterium]
MDEHGIKYYRPQTREELEALMESHEGYYLFLTGGDYNVKGYQEGDVLIDLQNLQMDQLVDNGDLLEIGGLSSLDTLFKDEILWADFREALSIEGGWNVRNGLSVDNFLRIATGRSPLLTCLRALDINLLVQPDIGLLALDEYLNEEYNWREFFIEKISFNKPQAVAYEQVARSPKDLPIVCVAAVRDMDGTIVVTVGGHEALLGGLVFEPESDIETSSIRDLFEETDDEWASAAYRQGAAEALLKRCLAKLEWN